MISASLYMIGLLHGIFWLKEPKQHSENVKKKAMIIDIFNYQNIVDPFKLLFQSSPGNNRLVIILVMFLIFIITGICQGMNKILVAPLFLNNISVIFQLKTVFYIYFYNQPTIGRQFNSVTIRRYRRCCICLVSSFCKKMSAISRAVTKSTTSTYLNGQRATSIYYIQLLEHFLFQFQAASVILQNSRMIFIRKNKHCINE